MTCPPPISFRPTPFACMDCKAIVTPKTYRELPARCDKCKRKHADKMRRRGLSEPEEELGSERPELGMTPGEYLAWRDRRIVRLFEQEPELPVSAIAERFDMSRQAVLCVLYRAGHVVREERGRDLLPAGPPVR